MSHMKALVAAIVLVASPLVIVEMLTASPPPVAPRATMAVVVAPKESPTTTVAETLARLSGGQARDEERAATRDKLERERMARFATPSWSAEDAEWVDSLDPEKKSMFVIAAKLTRFVAIMEKANEDLGPGVTAR